MDEAEILDEAEITSNEYQEFVPGQSVQPRDPVSSDSVTEVEIEHHSDGTPFVIIRFTRSKPGKPYWVLPAARKQ